VPFVPEDLNRTEPGGGFCFSSSPTDRNVVLNATMKGARLLAQAAALAGRPEWLEPARATIGYVVGRQAENGSWPYALGDARSWADHFHTCYNLDCLDAYARLSGDTGFAAALDRGETYYRENLFTDEGVPKYYGPKLHPLDATCCGQSLLTLLRFGHPERARRTAAWILDAMALPDGAFKYQISARGENRLVYMRWSVAWIYLGLARLERALAPL